MKRTKKTIGGKRVNVYVVNGTTYLTAKEAKIAAGIDKVKRKSPSNIKRASYIEGADELSREDYKRAYNRIYSRRHTTAAIGKRALRDYSKGCELTELVMEEAITLAKEREAIHSIKWDIDHMYPLQGKTVSGLHTALNLQVIPATMNRIKHNKLKYTERGEWLNELKA